MADIFLRDLANGTTSRLSISSAGQQGNGASFSPTVSAAGRFVTFSSNADNLPGPGGDIQASVEAAARAGAQVALPPTRIGDHGQCAIVIQGGIESGVWQV